MSKRKRTAKERVLERRPDARYCFSHSTNGVSYFNIHGGPYKTERMSANHATVKAAWADAAARLERKP